MKTQKFSVLLVVIGFGFQLNAYADMKLKAKYSTAEQTSENTLYTKGPRQRIEPGPGMAIISQRDTQQTIQIFDQNKTYVIVPPPGSKAADTESTAARQGGVVQYSVTVTDTGETQMMFGYLARRVRTVTVKEPGAGACDAVPQTVETDGWYIDYEPELPLEPAALPAAEETCRDEARHSHTGDGKLGFPLGYTAKIIKAGQTTIMTMTVVDFSTSSLDASLFEIPSGYKESEADSAMASMPAVPVEPKSDGALRVCVGEPVNRTDKSLGGGFASHEFVAGLIEAKVDAVALGGFTATDLNAIDLGVAREKQCDYVLTSEVTEVKKASGGLGKFGGMLNKASSLAAGGPAPKEKVEAKVNAKLASLTGLKPFSFSVSGSNGGGFGVMSAISLASTALGYGMFMKMFDPSMISAFSGMGGMGPAGLGMGGVPGMPRGGFDPGLGTVLSVVRTTQSMMAPAAPSEEGLAISDALKEVAKKVGDALRKKK